MISYGDQRFRHPVSRAQNPYPVPGRIFVADRADNPQSHFEEISTRFVGESQVWHEGDLFRRCYPSGEKPIIPELSIAFASFPDQMH